MSETTPIATNLNIKDPGSFPKRQITRSIPAILHRDADLMILWISQTEYVIKSWITDKPVANRKYNPDTKRVEKIDWTLEEEDRRLILLERHPENHYCLEEDYYKFNKKV